MKKAKKIIIPIIAVVLSIAILFTTALALIVGGLGCAFWFFFFDTGSYERYNNEPIREMKASDEQVYFVTEEGDGYLFGGYRHSQNRQYSNNHLRAFNKMRAPYPLKFYDGNIQYIYPSDVHDCLFITDDGVLYLMSDAEISEIAQGVSHASKTEYNSKICYVTVDGALKIIDNDNHTTLIDSGVKDARVFLDDVYVLWETGDLDKYILSGNECIFSQRILDNVQEVEVESTNVFHPYGHVAIVNILQNNGNLYAIGTYGLQGQADSYRYSTPNQSYDELTLIGENVTDFSLENSGTIMQLVDGSAKYLGFDTGGYTDKAAKFGEKDIGISNVKTACILERMVFCVDSDNIMYIWGGMGCCANDYYTPMCSTDTGYDIFIDQPVTVDFGKKKITY